MQFSTSRLLLAIILGVLPLSARAENLTQFITARAPEHFAFSLLVPKESTNERLKTIIYSIKEAREKGKLNEIGFDPTTPKGKKGLYMVIDVWIFKDPKWSTKAKLLEAFDVDGGSKAEKDFNEKVAAHYLYTFAGIEEGSIGYGGSKSYERIFFNKF